MNLLVRCLILSGFLFVVGACKSDVDRLPESSAPGSLRADSSSHPGRSLQSDSTRLDRVDLFSHVKTLASDAFEGREAGTSGGRAAFEYIHSRMQAADLGPCGDSLTHPFVFEAGSATLHGRNVVGIVPGTGEADGRIVITAHYDHLGIRGGEIYNGADDNASGTAALLEMAEYFVSHPAHHTLVFAALDAEEKGLLGARAFLQSECGSEAPIVLNINMDMVSRSVEHVLYAAGTFHYPQFKPVLQELDRGRGVVLMFGHDEPNTGVDDWSMASDHGPFHAQGIPFVYFGVEDHPGYHEPTDDFDAITPEFFIQASELIADAVVVLDEYLASRPPEN